MQHYTSLCIKIRPLLSQVSWTHALFYATCVRMLVLSIISPKEAFCGNIVTRWNAVNGFKNGLQIFLVFRSGNATTVQDVIYHQLGWTLFNT